MATDLERLMVRLEANASAFEREMNRANGVASRATRDIERSMDTSMRAIVTSAQGGAAGVNTALAAIGAGGLSIAGLVAYSDQWARLTNMMRAAGIPAQNINQTLGDLTRIALASNATLADTAGLFQSLTNAGKETGAGFAENLALVETFQKALQSEGKTADDVASAIQSLSSELKFGEGKASDYLEVLQEAPQLMTAVAKALGLTTKELREQIDEEEIGAGKLQQAILSAKPTVDATFVQQAPQLAQALTNIGTAVGQYVAQTASAFNPSQALASILPVVVENLVAIGPAALAVAEAVSVVLVGRAIIPMIGVLGATAIAAIASFVSAVGTMGVAAYAASAGMAVLSGATALLLNPVTLALAGIAALASLLYALREAEDPAAAAALAHAKGLGSLDAAIRQVNSSIPGTIQAVRDLAAAQLKAADQAIVYAQAQIAAARSMVQAAAAQREYLNLSGGGEGGIIGAANQSGLENTAVAKLDAANDALNERVKERGQIVQKLQKFDADLKAGEFGSKIDPNAGVDKDKKGGGGGGDSAEKKTAFDRELAQFEKKIALLNVERTSLGLLTVEREKAKAVVELEQAASRAGIDLSDEQKSKIQQLATAYGQATQSLEEARKAQEGFKELQQFIGSSLSSFFSDVISGGKNAGDALMNLTKRLADAALQAALLGQGPLASLFGMQGSGGGVGGIFGALLGGFKGFSFGGGGAGAATGNPFNIIPKLASGTSRVPADMLANIHEDEMVIPKYDADILRKGGAGGGSSQLEVSLSPDLVARLRAETRQTAVKITQAGIAENNARIPAMLAENNAR